MRYSPLSFSQVNESMIPEMVKLAEQFLSPQKDDLLLDLYCGYGLFSHTLGQKCNQVKGYELSAESINSAKEISKRIKSNNKMHFYQAMI